MGYAVATSGDDNTACIGERTYKVDDEHPHGRVRCFSWIGDYWADKSEALVGEIDGEANGYSLALSDEDGNVVAVGARFCGGNNEGAIVVYPYANGDWKPEVSVVLCRIMSCGETMRQMHLAHLCFSCSGRATYRRRKRRSSRIQISTE